MLSEMEILKRMDAITNEFAQLPQIGDFDISLEAIGDDGTIKVTITGLSRKGDTAEKIIHPQENLSFIGHTFVYPNTFTPRSDMFALNGLKNVFFNKDGYLITIRDGGTEEQLKVSSSHKKEVTEILETKLGDKFGEPIKKVIPKEMLFKVFFTVDDKMDYMIIAGDTIEQIRKTANDIITERGLDLEKNNIFSKIINN